MDKETIIEGNTGLEKVEKYDMIYGNTIRVWIRINGFLFKRLWDRSGFYPPVWTDEEYSIGDMLAIKDINKEKQLESIFMAYCLEHKFDAVKLLTPKQ